MQTRRVSLCRALEEGCEAQECQGLDCSDWVPGSNGATPADDDGYLTISAQGLTQKALPASVCSGFDPLFDPFFGVIHDAKLIPGFMIFIGIF